MSIAVIGDISIGRNLPSVAGDSKTLTVFAGKNSAGIDYGTIEVVNFASDGTMAASQT